MYREDTIDPRAAGASLVRFVSDGYLRGILGVGNGLIYEAEQVIERFLEATLPCPSLTIREERVLCTRLTSEPDDIMGNVQYLHSDLISFSVGGTTLLSLLFVANKHGKIIEMEIIKPVPAGRCV